MILNEYTNIGIAGISCATSTNWVSVESLKNGENDAVLDRFVKKTNVIGHYECNQFQTAADLSYVSAENIIQKCNIDRREIGIVIFVTQYPDYKSPSTACVLQSRLSLPIDCIAFDVNLGCSGFVYGLNIVSSLMQTSNIKYGLLLAGDTPSKGVRSDNSRNLFGDAGSATLLYKNDNKGEILSFASRTNGNGFKALLRPFGYSKHPDIPDTKGVYNEIDVFNFAIQEAPKLINELLDKYGYNAEDFDCLALHQANMMIMKQIAKHTKFPYDKMLISIDRFANTSAASIPLSFVKKYGEDMYDKNLRSLICGYGVGLSWAAGIVNINVQNIFPLIETDEYFDDGLYV